MKIRNGYSDGSHSEIEVSKEPKWQATQIKERGINLLKFMEVRWNVRFGDDLDKFLFLPTGDQNNHTLDVLEP